MRSREDTVRRRRMKAVRMGQRACHGKSAGLDHSLRAKRFHPCGAGREYARWHISGSSSRSMNACVSGYPHHGGHATSSEFNFSSEFVFSSALGPSGRLAGLFSRGGWERGGMRLMGTRRINLGAYDQTSCRRTVRGGHFQRDLMAVSSARKCIR